MKLQILTAIAALVLPPLPAIADTVACPADVSIIAEASERRASCTVTDTSAGFTGYARPYGKITARAAFRNGRGAVRVVPGDGTHEITTQAEFDACVTDIVLNSPVNCD